MRRSWLLSRWCIDDLHVLVFIFPVAPKIISDLFLGKVPLDPPSRCVSSFRLPLHLTIHVRLNVRPNVGTVLPQLVGVVGALRLEHGPVTFPTSVKRDWSTTIGIRQLDIQSTREPG